MLKQILKKLLPSSVIGYLTRLKLSIFDGYAKKSYSQEGEDMILARIFSDKINGFYVDVGAHHPKRFSNTYFFYKKGWSGINIDAMPNSMELFKKVRPRDINIEKPISDKTEFLTYYMFNEPALNGFSKELSDSRNSNKYRILSTSIIETATLDQILEAHLPYDKTIDFLSIDVEGFDFAVLQSFDIHKYKPKIILVELLETRLDLLSQNNVTKYLNHSGYEAISKAFNTVIFQRRDSIDN